MSRPNWKSPGLDRSLPNRVHTRNSVEPGRNSHRPTAFTRSDLMLKSGCGIRKLRAGDTGQAVASLQDGLSLWRGDVMTGCAPAGWGAADGDSFDILE